jgi:hypothetical protein
MDLSKLIKNNYNNSKLTRKDYNTTSTCYNAVKDEIKFFCDCYDFDHNIIQYGSYSLNTVMVYPSINNDIDIDIGVTLNDINENIDPNDIKNDLFQYLSNKIDTNKILIENKEIPIKITFKDLNLHIDIVIYKMCKRTQYLGYKNEWIKENSKKQYDILKGAIENHDEIKQLICFLKFIYKSGKINEKSKLPSIAITEMIVQDYYEKLDKYINNYLRFNKIYNKYEKQKIYKKLLNDNGYINGFIKYEYNDIGYKLLTILFDKINELEISFRIENSGCNENLLNNNKRKLNKRGTINTLKKIYNELLHYYNYKIICSNDTILRNVFYSDNKMLLIPNNMYSEEVINNDNKLSKFYNSKVINYKPFLCHN